MSRSTRPLRGEESQLIAIIFLTRYSTALVTKIMLYGRVFASPDSVMMRVLGILTIVSATPKRSKRIAPNARPYLTIIRAKEL